MSVKLVMGAQRDSLEKLEKFGGEDGGVIFPHFRQDLRDNFFLTVCNISAKDGHVLRYRSKNLSVTTFF